MIPLGVSPLTGTLGGISGAFDKYDAFVSLTACWRSGKSVLLMPF